MKLKSAIVPILLFLTGALIGQVTPPQKVSAGNLECEVILDIYDGLFDWTTGTSWSGSGSPLSNDKKVDPGAVTVANLNDTNGNNIVDAMETNIPTNAPNRREVDLIKIAIRKKNPNALLSGSISLVKKSGSIKLWKEPTKQTEVSTNVPIIVQASDLPAIFFIEATQVSAAVGDIWFEATFNGNSDEVKATAVWVTKQMHWTDASSTPVPGVNPLENVGGFVKFAINNNVAENGTLYGHGDCRKKPISTSGWVDNTFNDKEYGGRILMEWKIAPVDAVKVASFDVTRQRKTRTWSVDYGQPNFTPSSENTDFPFDMNLDNETPNDDTNGDEDRIPKNGFLYSWDNPSIYKKYTAEEFRSFHVSKNSFKEFVRIRTKTSPFTNNDATLQGSRASNKFDWKCVYYARRDNMYELAIDAALSSSAQLKSTQIDVNTFFTVTTNTTSVSYEVGVFNIVYYGVQNNNMKELRIGRFDGTNNVSETFSIPANQDTWNINFEGVQLTLKELTVIPNFTFINFNTFKTNAGVKDNIIANGSYTNFTR